MDASSFLALVLVLLALGAMVAMRQPSHDPFVGGLMKASMFPARFLGRVSSTGAKTTGAVAARAAPGVGKGAAAGGTKVSNWQKGETIFSGLSLAALPLLFIPFGGGGDEAADGSLPEGAEEQAAMVSSVSISSVSSSVVMVMMMMMMAMSNNE